MSSAPYWGALPSRTVSTRRDQRRQPDADDYDDAPRRLHQYQYQYQQQQQQQQQQGEEEPPVIPERKRLSAGPRPNRISVQTTHTDAPTESTLSPFASPTEASFAPGGLAPRPTSNQYAARHQQDAPESRRSSRRRSQPAPDDYYDEAAPTPPPAPDVPRAPPVSYRSPFSNGGSPGGYSSAPPARPSRVGAPALYAEYMDPEDYYKDASGERYRGPPIRDELRARQGQLVDPGRAHPAGNGSPVAKGVPGAVVPDSRRVSLGPHIDRPKQFADDRSPLQKIELEYGRAKEEKRRRAVAAERKLKERSGVPEIDKPVAQQVRFRERRAPAEGSSPRADVTPQPPTVVATRGPLSQNPPEEGRVYGNSSRRPAAPVAMQPQSVEAEDASIPKRNLSFRERAAKSRRKDIPLPNGNEGSPEPPGSPRDTFAPPPASVARTASNKLKKQPPADPRYRDPRAAPYYARETKPESPEPQTSGWIRGKGASREPPSARQGIVVPPPAAAHVPAGGDDLVGITRRSTDPAHGPGATKPQDRRAASSETRYVKDDDAVPSRSRASLGDSARQPPVLSRRERRDSDDESDRPEHSPKLSRFIFDANERLAPGYGMFAPPKYLDEWKKATVATLSGPMLDLSDEQVTPVERNQAWWEGDYKRRRSSLSGRQRKAEAFDGEYDENNTPTRFKPALYLLCGPLLRYCGIRREKVQHRNTRNGASGAADREIWRGSVMIVTRDADSLYDIAPTLRLFVQPIELLPPPPAEVIDTLPPEYVDPIVGHPKLGRKGETLYLRPVEHLPEEKDLSRDETENGLFEPIRSALDYGDGAHGDKDTARDFASRRKRVEVDGESTRKYKEVKGFRLHAEKGCTFWRFNIEVELRDRQQRIAYRINRGPSIGFWVPARGQSMNIMFYSCNGFSKSVKTDTLCGPDPLWRDVLNNHQTQPFHVMVGGGDQVYNDVVMEDCADFADWLSMRGLERHNHPFTPEMQDELEQFYFQRYCMWFSQGLFGLANSQIPMVNMFDDHDIFDGYGSYSDHEMNSPVFCGLGSVAFKYYMLFQHQSIPTETENGEPSWITGAKPGPYIKENSRSLFMSLGGKMALLAVDCRTERNERDVVTDETWKKIMDRCYAEIIRGETHHLLVLLGVPIAYPRLVWLENVLTSRLMDPIKALGRTGIFGDALNKLDGGAEVLDDLNDHWTAKHHKEERAIVVKDLRDLSALKSVRVTILSGDVHLAAVGQFYSNPKLGIPKHEDFRYIPNIVSSAIANAPPPDILADVLNKRNKVHHFDAKTDEDMIPMFTQGVDGKLRNNTRLLPHRNWCSIREWVPGSTPPSTPSGSYDERSPSPPAARGGLLRRLSGTGRRAQYRTENVLDSRPPPSSGGFFRSFSRSRRSSESGKGSRSSSLSRAGSLFSRRKRPSEDWDRDQSAVETDDEEPETTPPPRDKGKGVSMRGGGEEYDTGDESYFTARPPRRARTTGDEMESPALGEAPPGHRPFHRTPTGQSGRQRRDLDVNLEGGLDICINAEVSKADPAGITVPYRLLVPRLFFDSETSREYGSLANDEESLPDAPATPMTPAAAPKPARFFSFRRRNSTSGVP